MWYFQLLDSCCFVVACTATFIKKMASQSNVLRRIWLLAVPSWQRRNVLTLTSYGCWKKERKKHISQKFGREQNSCSTYCTPFLPPGQGDSFLKQCSGSMTFWCGSGSADPCLWLIDPDPEPGSGSCYFRRLPSGCQQKTNFLTQFVLLVTFWRYFYIIFQRWKVKKSQQIVGFKIFLIIYAWW